MNQKVVALNSGAIVPGEADKEIIEVLERYLAEAKRGEITGVALAVCRPNENIGTEWCGVCGAKFPLGYAVTLLQSRYYLSQIEASRE